MKTYETMPEDLPRPIDDGACDHLVGTKLPNIDLMATDGTTVNLSVISRLTVIYCYPMTGKPGIPLPEGWDDIPGARGCTPQSCAFRDHHAELSALGADVFGLSTKIRIIRKKWQNGFIYRFWCLVMLILFFVRPCGYLLLRSTACVY